MRIIVAPQEFKGTLTAKQAAERNRRRRATRNTQRTIEMIPLSDGGPGLVQTLVSASGGRAETAVVHDPLGRPVEAEWGVLADGTAVIEMAAAAGLWRLEENARDPRITTTFGVGEIIRAALDAGRKRMIVGLGGSATNDGGAGMAAALGVRLLDADGAGLPPGGAALARLDRIDASGLDPRLAHCTVVAASDVSNPLCGAEGASLVYGPQKGATPEVARELDDALRHYARIVERDVGVRVLDTPGAGAAGGLGAGVIAFLRAKVRTGIDVVAEAIGLRERISGADLVLTGEGKLDAQTGFGKTITGVARIANECGIPVIAVVGALEKGSGAVDQTVAVIEPVVGEGITVEDALARPAETLAETAERAVRKWLSGG